MGVAPYKGEVSAARAAAPRVCQRRTRVERGEGRDAAREGQGEKSEGEIFPHDKSP